VERVIRENWRVVAGELKISQGSVHHVIHDVLQYQKVSARWVPKQLIPELKERRVDVCEILLRRYEAEGDGFLHLKVTGDECWVHYFQPARSGDIHHRLNQKSSVQLCRPAN
jgi:hypothetical protein